MSREGKTVRRISEALVMGSLALMCLLLPHQGWTKGSNLEKAINLLQQQSRTGKGEFINFLTGAASAYRWVSTNAESNGPPQTYCPPLDLMLDGRTYAKIALEEYKRGENEYARLRAYPVDVLTLALWRGLRDKFPCKSDEALTTLPSSSNAHAGFTVYAE
jgi:hypothetical protein